MKWQWLKFLELSVEQLYQCIHLRERVFVVEQKCIYLDCDGNDPKAWHLLGYRDGQLVAYLRAFAPGVRYPEASFGRVVTAPEARGLGLGKEMIDQALLHMDREFKKPAIHISAQAYLEKFYSGFGFERQLSRQKAFF